MLLTGTAVMGRTAGLYGRQLMQCQASISHLSACITELQHMSGADALLAKQANQRHHPESQLTTSCG